MHDKRVFRWSPSDEKQKRGKPRVTWRSILENYNSLINLDSNTAENEGICRKNWKSLTSLWVIEHGNEQSYYSK